MKKRMVGNVPGNVLGMLADLNLKLQHGTRTPEQLDKFLKGKNPFEGLDYSLILNKWEKYFFKIHQLKADFSNVIIPKADDDDFPWFVCVPENFSTEQAYSGGKQLYSAWKRTGKVLDDILDLSFGRDSRRDPYIVRFHASWEADEALKNFSANMIAEKRINTSTLKERLLLGDFLYCEYKKHLDVENITLCSGSRDSDGNVLHVHWNLDHRELPIHRHHPDYADSDLRAREVVS
jgi:hypothetical protein